MAKSPSHKLGEIIGAFFEEAMIAYLSPIVSDYGFYLDYRHPRAARKNASEVIGKDAEGNKHKLDIVIEEGGSDEKFGIPRAYIEMAWRRYKKHSKNKVQEIAGAILPLRSHYSRYVPFYSAVLAGDFTDSSIKQLESQGFHVLYFSYETICHIFQSTLGFSIEWEEDTDAHILEETAAKLSSLTLRQREALIRKFISTLKEKLESFSKVLIETLGQKIVYIHILPIHGSLHSSSSVSDAINFLTNYNEDSSHPLLKYEISIIYNTGEKYSRQCRNRTIALQFLNEYRQN